MGFDFNPTEDVSVQALRLHAKRLEMLASNLSNADTPNYKARDIDFRAALAAATEGGPPMKMTMTAPAHLGGGARAEPEMLYRVPSAPSLDGNTVDAQIEYAAFAETSLRYQASLKFVGDDFKDLISALKGE